MRYILASASPRRKELLEQIGLSFQVITGDTEEIITKDKPGEIVMELATVKAESIFKNNTKAVVLGADTIVALDDEILGKPANQDEAYKMIKNIQGRKHAVYTGVCLVYTEAGEKKISCFYEKTDVEVYSMDEAEIMAYISTIEPYDKAGGYGIQGPFAAYIKGIEGDYNNVVGLPVGRVYQELKKINYFKEIPE